MGHLTFPGLYGQLESCDLIGKRYESYACNCYIISKLCLLVDKCCNILLETSLVPSPELIAYPYPLSIFGLKELISMREAIRAYNAVCNASKDNSVTMTGLIFKSIAIQKILLCVLIIIYSILHI